MKQRHMILILSIGILGIIILVTGFWAVADAEYASGYANGHTDGYHAGYTKGSNDGNQTGYNNGTAAGYNNGYSSGELAGQQQELDTIENWIIGTSCSQTSSGYIYFKLYRNTEGQYTYTCLVNTY